MNFDQEVNCLQDLQVLQEVLGKNQRDISEGQTMRNVGNEIDSSIRKQIDIDPAFQGSIPRADVQADNLALPPKA